MKTDWQIAQLNIANSHYHLDSEPMIGFTAQLDYINRLADESDGFVWRLKEDLCTATDNGVDPFLIVNLSVWETIDSLFDFVYTSTHKYVMGNKRQWFKSTDDAHQVLWWVKAGHQPDVTEAMAKLAYLNQHGSGPTAFTFKDRYAPPT